MHRLTAIFLVLIFLVSQLSTVWIIVDFKVHQEFIAEVLCINKDEPTVLCSGKCYLNEELKKAEEKQQQDLPNTSREKLATVLHIQELGRSLFGTIDTYQEQSPFGACSELSPSAYIRDIFHPPQPTLLPAFLI